MVLGRLGVELEEDAVTVLHLILLALHLELASLLDSLFRTHWRKQHTSENIPP